MIILLDLIIGTITGFVIFLVFYNLVDPDRVFKWVFASFVITLVLALISMGAS